MVETYNSLGNPSSPKGYYLFNELTDHNQLDY